MRNWGRRGREEPVTLATHTKRRPGRALTGVGAAGPESDRRGRGRFRLRRRRRGRRGGRRRGAQRALLGAQRLARLAAALIDRLLGLRGLAHAAAGDHGVGDARREQADGPERVVVARDGVVHLVGVAVGVDDADNRNLELARLVHGDLLVTRVDDEDGVGQAIHVADAVEVLLEAALLLVEAGDLLLRQDLVPAV